MKDAKTQRHKIWLLVIGIFLVFGLVGVSFGEEEEAAKAKAYLSFLENKLSKIENYINTLEAKLTKEEAAKNWKKVKNLNKLVAKERKRVEIIKVQIAEQQGKLAELEGKPTIAPAKVEAKAIQPTIVSPRGVPPKRGIVVEGGLVGGGMALDVGYTFSLRSNLGLKLNAGYSLGNDYSAAIAQLGLIYKIDPEYFAGLSIDYGNYSKEVEDTSKFLRNLPKGSNWGVGIFVGKSFGSWQVEGGFSTALWPFLRVGYNF